MKGTTLGARLREARQAAGMSQAELARKIGSNRASVSQWEGDMFTSMRIDYLVKISDALRIHPRWLATGKQSTFDAGLEGVVEIPVYDWDSLAKVSGNQEPERISTMLATQANAPSKAFAVVARSDAMAPDIQEGETVVIDPDAPIQNGDIVVALVCGAPVLRRYRLEGGQHLLLAAEDRYPLIASPDRPTMVGRVVSATRTF